MSNFTAMRDYPFPPLQTFLHKNSYPILLVLFCLWTCAGIFPLYCYESDSMYTIAGCSVLYNQGFVLPPVYSYDYDMQPFVYYLVAGCRCLVPVLTCEQIFCLLTGICSLLFAIASIRFIHRLTGIRKEIILISLVLIPESVAIGMYPNTAILAALPFICALNSLLDKQLRIALVWMCLAPLFRVDILIVYPAVFPLFLWQGDSVATALKKSSVCALTVIAVTILSYWLLQANPLDSTWKRYEFWNEHISSRQRFLALFTFYTPLGLLLLPVGICTIYRRKSFCLLAVTLLPMLFNHLLYARIGCATKHYLYILPFTALLTTTGLTALTKRLKEKRFMKWCVLLFLALYFFGSVRFCPASRPWYGYPQSDANARPFLKIFSEHITSLNTSFGLGAGFCIRTEDEKMLASGHFFYPFFIHDLKLRHLEKRKQAQESLSGERKYILIGWDWESTMALPLALTDRGYSLESTDKNGRQCLHLTGKDGTRVTVPILSQENSTPPDTEENPVDKIRRVFAKQRNGDSPVYFFPNSSNLEYLFEEFASEGFVGKTSEGLYQIHFPHNNEP